MLLIVALSFTSCATQQKCLSAYDHDKPKPTMKKSQPKFKGTSYDHNHFVKPKIKKKRLVGPYKRRTVIKRDKGS